MSNKNNYHVLEVGLPDETIILSQYQMKTLCVTRGDLKS